MSMRDVTRKPTRASTDFIAESIRRLDSSELAKLVTKLCEDNMGSKLQTALSYENLDKQFRNQEQ